MANTRERFSLGLFFAATLVSAPVTLAAPEYADSRLEIQVLDGASGTAVANAAVCLGTQANAIQFGAKRTDGNGRVRFDDLPSNSLLVTVSRAGFKGAEQRLQAASQSRVMVLKLVSGGGGPECAAPGVSGSQQESSGLEVAHITIEKAAAADQMGRVYVSVAVQGAANQIRIGESPDFSGAEWQKLQSPLAYQLSEGSGFKDIYVQVRRYAQTEGADIEVVSPVRMVRYRR